MIISMIDRIRMHLSSQDSLNGYRTFFILALGSEYPFAPLAASLPVLLGLRQSLDLGTHCLANTESSG